MLNTPKYSGEPTPQALASGLATLGRYGDEFMVHAAEGETVIPPEIFEANPQLKADLFRQMAMMGIKDPNRYVVGNSLNSINPLTGQPEFFFKKIFKSIKKVFKKALPIIAPIVGNMLLPGIGGIIASGLVTKLQGGSWGDVLKSAAMSYGVSAIGSGLSGAFSSAPGATFMGGLTKGLAAPFKGISSLFGAGSGAASGVAGGIGGGAVYGPSAGGTLPSGFNSSGVAGGIGGGSVYGPSAGGADGFSFEGKIDSTIPDGMTASGDFGDFSGSLSDIGGTDLSPGYDALGPTAGAIRLQTLPELDAANAASFAPTPAEAAPAPTPAEAAPQKVVQAASEDREGFFGDAGKKAKAFFNNSPEQASLELDQKYASEVARIEGKLASQGRDPLTVKQLNDLHDKLVINVTPEGILSRSAPLIAATGAAGLGIAALSGAFTEEEEEYKANPNKSDKEIEAYEKWGQIPDKNSLEAQKQFGIWNMKPYVTRSQFERQTGGRSARPDWRFLPESNAMGVAMGGEVVGPGTGTSDSIPARLSDGEFVMTADAVRNAGGGNRDLGAARMYDMMRRFEGGVA
jgi:hypothetical protein